ncbi:MAG: prepilin peptidase [Clostridiales bacterium]|nr:prepilin peptidase [Clostridiales bacterium]MBR4429725.1 prepilin peptidase [Clostridiales bacterium]MBR4947304.1 prepilin peptidase [Clostridiales bacterium]
MNIALYYVFAVVAGILAGALVTWLFGKFPDKWLQDYGVTPQDPDYRPSKRMRPFPEGLIAVVFCVACYCVTIFFCRNAYIEGQFRPMHLAVIFLVIPVLLLVMMADKLNRIIPDQFTIYIAFCGVLSVLSDVFEGSVWFTDGVKWYVPVLNKVIASLIGGGVIWLIGFLSITFLGREGMGMGDMWLLFATGLITGCYGLVVLIYVSIFSALIFAIPLLIRKRKRIAAEKKRIAESPDPRKEKLKIQREKAAIHFAEDPDYMAFGPFLALGCAVFAIMEPFFFEKMLDTLNLLGVYF